MNIAQKSRSIEDRVIEESVNYLARCMTEMSHEIVGIRENLETLRISLVNLYCSVSDEHASPEFKEAALKQAADVIASYGVNAAQHHKQVRRHF